MGISLSACKVHAPSCNQKQIWYEHLSNHQLSKHVKVLTKELINLWERTLNLLILNMVLVKLLLHAAAMEI
jgi:hypothetical protein